MPSHSLWVVPKWPLPATDGGRRATVSLIKNLTAQGEKISLLTIVEPSHQINIETAVNELGVQEVFLVPQRQDRSNGKLRTALYYLSAFFRSPLTPLTMDRFCSSETKSIIAERLETGDSNGQSWTRVIYEGLHPAIHAARNGLMTRDPFPANCEIVYRAHNQEAAIWARKAEQTSSLPFRIFLQVQAKLVSRFERSVLSCCDSVATVSNEDLCAFREFVSSVKGAVIPVGYDFGEATPKHAKGQVKILFLGKFDWPPNKDGLTWFLEKVWPSVHAARPEMKLLVAGSGNIEPFRRFHNKMNIDLLGCVDSLEDLYAESTVAIVPIFYGSGTRVKVIEACSYGRPCLSTELGVEGVGLEAGKSYIQAETAEEWISSLIELNIENVKRIGEAAFLSASTRFDARLAAQDFQELVDRD